MASSLIFFKKKGDGIVQTTNIQVVKTIVVKHNLKTAVRFGLPQHEPSLYLIRRGI